MKIIGFESLNGRSDISLNYENSVFELQTSDHRKVYLFPYRFIRKVAFLLAIVSSSLVELLLKIDSKLSIKKPIDKNLANLSLKFSSSSIQDLFSHLFYLKDHKLNVDLELIFSVIYIIFSEEKEKTKQYDTTYWNDMFQISHKFISAAIDEMIAENPDTDPETIINEGLNNIEFAFPESDASETYLKNKSFLIHHLPILEIGITVFKSDIENLEKSGKITLDFLVKILFRSILKEYYEITKQKKEQNKWNTLLCLKVLLVIMF